MELRWYQKHLHSTMVRLKVERHAAPRSVSRAFTFHYGQIKRLDVSRRFGSPRYLHSTMVRLKDESTRFSIDVIEIYIPLWSD